MATAYSCDRCGETIDEPTWFTTLRQEGVFPEWSLLCKSCADSFEEWLENSDYLQPDEEVRE